VSIEQVGGGAAVSATVEAGGAFRATVTPQATTSYRAVSGEYASPAVDVLVLDRRVQAAAVARKGRVAVNTRVLPASPGATVVLQLRLPERFGWWPVQRRSLDEGSRAHFTLRPKHRVRARVVLTMSDGATPLTQSATLRLRPAR
jgi:hypothetical protein